MGEGTANFFNLYTRQLTEDFVSLKAIQKRAYRGTHSNCTALGVTNIHELTLLGAAVTNYCPYALGEAFVLGMYLSLGHEILSASLRQLFNTRKTEENIYQAFLSNTPLDRQDEFRDVYLCLHGRPIPGYTPALRVTPAHVRDALVALYNATNGPGWKNDENWLSDAPIGEWHGVVTDCLGNFFELYLRDNNLTGSIPPELGNLSNLESLDLSQNQLTGSIPAELGNLSKLQELNLGSNRLSGPIPPWLSDLSSLLSLNLWGNQFTGPIPPELGTLLSLRALILEGNQLTGPIPPELGSLASLTWLNLGKNGLTGPITAGDGQPNQPDSAIPQRQPAEREDP